MIARLGRMLITHRPRALRLCRFQLLAVSDNMMNGAIFEVTGADIGSLTDGDLRTLVARLALAEMRVRGGPLSAVTAGGNQDAADGGIDVRVECPIAVPSADFVPRAVTGFQVKRPDMSASGINEEMRPGGVLRPAIADIAAASGSYIIVSAQGSLADRPLAVRRKAMRRALGDLPASADLHTDFYDRDRLATWINEYPGIAAWVRMRVGRGTAGWSSVGTWSGVGVSEAGPYLLDDKACLVDERSREREALPISEGIVRLRSALGRPRQCIRLVGLSGFGKTRLVQALFESSVGEEPLDPGIAIYTDYSTETDPTARDMARQLVMSKQRATLIVDNCNPTTHAELARICSEEASNISLLTVEYDVRDDEPERTEVFRLKSAAPGLVAQWLQGKFSEISQVDRDRIAEFSDGNFRVARAVAETLGRGETLGKLKSRELFERIFQQRNQPDRDLQTAAEELALLYSIDGEGTAADGELAKIAAIRGGEVNRLYGALVELGRRGIVQTRGRWRAILPHAIANPLASFALERLPAADFDRLAATLTPRMLRSLSRRLGYLHDDGHARTAVARWLRTDGPLGDLFAMGETGIHIIVNLAPVAPEVVLAKLEAELDGPTGRDLLEAGSTHRWQWVRLIKALAYEGHMFETAAMMLARFVAAEPLDTKQNSASGPFGELFQLHLSGTRATPEQRRAVIDRLARSGDPESRRVSVVALDSLLGTRQFSASSDLDFGARSRDWGWCPRINGDVCSWYDHAIRLAVELSPILDEVRALLGGKVVELWSSGGCHQALDHAATTLVKPRPWIEGWLGFRAALKYEGDAMDLEVKARLDSIVRRLEPLDLLHRARAVVLNRAMGGWDVADCEPDGDDAMQPWRKALVLAREIGKALARDDETRRQFIGELFAERHASRAFECGRGLAEGADELGPMLEELTDQFTSTDASLRNETVLGGFIHQAHIRDPAFTGSALEFAIEDSAIAPILPYLQGVAAIDDEGIARLRRAISRGKIGAGSFSSIANGMVGSAPPAALGLLLMDIAAPTDGVEIALDILHMRFHRDQDNGMPVDPGLVEVGRNLLGRADFSKKGSLRDFGLDAVIRICCSGVGGEAMARLVCQRVRKAMETSFLSSHDLGYVLKGLFDIQPMTALDVFLLPGPALKNHRIFEMDLGSGTPIEHMDVAILLRWAEHEAVLRYPLLGRFIAMFRRMHGDEENHVAPLFLEILAHAPDKRAFLGDFWTRLHPHSWSGSLADILIRRRAQVLTLGANPDPDIRRWVDDMLPEIDGWIERERVRDRSAEESFE